MLKKYLIGTFLRQSFIPMRSKQLDLFRYNILKIVKVTKGKSKNGIHVHLTSLGRRKYIAKEAAMNKTSNILYLLFVVLLSEKHSIRYDKYHTLLYGKPWYGDII